jgi:hypothetical protein
MNPQWLEQLHSGGGRIFKLGIPNIKVVNAKKL